MPALLFRFGILSLIVLFEFGELLCTRSFNDWLRVSGLAESLWLTAVVRAESQEVPASQ
jgi:hypothetical protein